MRLFFIEPGGCKHITEVIPGIFAVAQMEQEFAPYIKLNYLPYRDDAKGGIILQTKNETIKRDYTFHNKTDIEDLRNLIWYYLKKDYDVKDLAAPQGCLKDFREYKPVNSVVQGFNEKKKALAKDVCCKVVLDTITPAIIQHNILHEVYKLSNVDIQDRKICEQVRGGECVDNYPPNTDTYRRCMAEVQWLCQNGYPVNKTVNRMNQIVKDIRKKLYNELKNNNLKVNKKLFDQIIDAGLFQDLGNRMGNKVANDKNVRASIDQIFTEKDYYLGLIEGFDDNSSLFSFEIPHSKIGGLILLIFVLLLVYEVSKKD